MFKPHICIIGGGSVGSAIAAYIKEKGNWCTVEIHDPNLHQNAEIEAAHIIHITVPFHSMEQYETMWKELVPRIKPSAMVIIHSTINPLFLEHIGKESFDIYYNPIRVPEKNMAQNIGYHVWYFANLKDHDSYRIKGYLDFLNIHYKEFIDAKALAYGKLMETTQFGMQIAFVQMMKRVCDEHGWNFETAYTNYQSQSNYQADYREEEKRFVPRPIFTPNKIGGKCVMQNLKLVDDANLADLSFIEFILDSNDKVKDQ
jgi:hypothetical protein